MSRLAVEINGAGLIVADDDRILAEEPAYAYADGGRIVTGAAAYAQARLYPARTQTGFWSRLSLEDKAAESAGELAYEHLRQTWEKAGRKDAHAVFVVPGNLDPQQLGLVLGIAHECGISVEAMVDSAVAASSLRYPDRDLFHVDASLRALTVTRIGQSNGATVDALETNAQVGLGAFTDEMLRSIARVFVLETRFDPLHDAVTEQALLDGLPGWLDALQRDGTATAQLVVSGAEVAVELTIERLRSASLRLAREIVRLITGLRSAQKIAALQISDRLARVPGLCAEIARMQGVETITLQRGAAVFSALQRVSPDESEHPEVRLLRRLPFVGEATVSEIGATEASRSDASRPEPTHVVFRGIAYRLSGDRVEIVGKDAARSLNGSEIIAIGNEASAEASMHCVLERGPGNLSIVRCTQEMLFVNGERVDGRRDVVVGDVVRIGDSGIELHIVAVES